MVTDLDRALDAIGDRTRRLILGRLAAGPLDVRRLADRMPVGRTAVSMHLRVLKDAGLVEDHAVGNRRVYHVAPDALRRLRDHFDWFWERSLDAYREAAETRAREERMASEREITVVKSVVVRAPLAVAFDVFVGQQWWPIDTHHLADRPRQEAVLEPFAGGRWYERAADGTETDWGTVLAWQPPHGLLLTWQVSPQWTYEADPARGSEIEVTFTPEGPDQTRVDLVHRHLERYGAQAERMRRILEGKGGEPLTAYARHIASVRRPVGDGTAT
jgi:DNA-binding transcriptional ArsR family regulator